MQSVGNRRTEPKFNPASTGQPREGGQSDLNPNHWKTHTHTNTQTRSTDRPNPAKPWCEDYFLFRSRAPPASDPLEKRGAGFNFAWLKSDININSEPLLCHGVSGLRRMVAIGRYSHTSKRTHARTHRVKWNERHPCIMDEHLWCSNLQANNTVGVEL